MSKYCYVCGREIKDNEWFYCVGPNSHVCNDNKCYKTYFWDRLTAKFVVDTQHEYAVIGSKIYSIGSDNDEPRGMSGRPWTIEFFDGTVRETNSLWYLAEVPEDKKHIFVPNARLAD